METEIGRVDECMINIANRDVYIIIKKFLIDKKLTWHGCIARRDWESNVEFMCLQGPCIYEELGVWARTGLHSP